MIGIPNDLLLAANKGDVSALCLIDLTVAFDTVDRDFLMFRLERQFGLRGEFYRLTEQLLHVDATTG